MEPELFKNILKMDSPKGATTEPRTTANYPYSTVYIYSRKLWLVQIAEVLGLKLSAGVRGGEARGRGVDSHATCRAGGVHHPFEVILVSFGDPRSPRVMFLACYFFVFFCSASLGEFVSRFWLQLREDF